MSPVAGYGLFATELIGVGEAILDFSIGEQMIINGRQADENYRNGFDYMLQVDDDKYVVSVRGVDSQNQGYINHSCEPNCGIKESLQIVAIRDIEQGEEITFDYAMSEASDYSMDCKCGSRNCRVTITGNDWKLPSLQEQYRGFFSGYIQKKLDQSSKKPSV